MNPYMQYFCGETIFQHRFPCDPSDFVHFRKRIGEKGIEKIFLQSVKLHGKDAEERLLVSDTTVQGNNTTFPTDQKLYKKVIEDCHDIAQQEGVEQRQSYEKTSKELLRQTHNGKHPNRWKKARAAKKKLRTLARRVVRELERKLDEIQIQRHADRLEITATRTPYNDTVNLWNTDIFCWPTKMFAAVGRNLVFGSMSPWPIVTVLSSSRLLNALLSAFSMLLCWNNEKVRVLWK